ncbi:IQ motif and SEC7 domain-containing protein 3 isoform X1 [Protopterus annectens]|uniref:IQ motif and SEC7 domain-containing protein 3 isoform X1 n=2 Tax=Protopterus annectens TaxID=7888 RepID=UPI001CFAF24C|nr:IQ motif and SEC7 domain-containing protein 3 isoform X1 [Protopterus annectens]
MESLLENPMKAVLYLKELTTIVQNQQSLIQSQRQRIDELERRLDDLSRENRSLRDQTASGQVQQHPPPAQHQHQHPPCAKLPATPASSSKGAQHLQPQQHHSLPAAQSKERQQTCCKALIQQKTPAIGKAILGRKPENETVLHQFCCPVADCEQKPFSSCSQSGTDSSSSNRKACSADTDGTCRLETDSTKGHGSDSLKQTPKCHSSFTDSKEEKAKCSGMVQRASLHHTASPVRIQRSKGAASCSHAASSDYELSLDLRNKQVEMLEHKYGGHLVSRKAACTIQTAFRQYQLSKNFEKIRNSLLESRMPRRISLRKVRVHNTEGFASEKALLEGYNFVGIPLVRSPSLPASISGALTELEDSFTEQVQSLAKSIDDALNTWSLKTLCSLQGGSTYQFTETFSASTRRASEDVEKLEGSDQEKEERHQEGIPKSSSSLMMAFRDVTVQIDRKNISVSTSVVESTSVSVSDCLSSAESGTVQSTREMDSSENGKANTLQESGAQSNSVALQNNGDELSLATNGVNTTAMDSEQMIIQKFEASEDVTEGKKTDSELGDNLEQLSSSSTSTSAKSTSELSSKEALQAMILSLPRYHCENPASCKSPTLSTDIIRKRLYRIGLNLFNINPDKGIQFLISRGFIPDTPIGVAHFLLQRKGLSRQMIGEFLGNSKRQFNRDVLDCVVDEMDFSNMELDEALRKFQAHIRVQGEAQKVERLIEAFSQRYCMCNPDVVQQFHNPDTIFILAFAIILLNTDMYSPNIKPDRKMMLEDFIRNLRGVDDGADIPREMVAGIYERIQQKELKSNEDHVTYVTKVENSIVGMKTVLSVPHRRLVCCSRLFEISDINKLQKQAAHQREVFLFNDLLVILKLCPKKKSSSTYTFCKSVGLLGMQFHLFENEYYAHGISLLSPISGSEKKQVLHFCAQSAEELQKFVEDLKESVAEVSELEQVRIDWELEKQQGAKTPSSGKNNGTPLEIRAKQESPDAGEGLLCNDSHLFVVMEM